MRLDLQAAAEVAGSHLSGCLLWLLFAQLTNDSARAKAKSLCRERPVWECLKCRVALGPCDLVQDISTFFRSKSQSCCAGVDFRSSRGGASSR